MDNLPETNVNPLGILEAAMARWKKRDQRPSFKLQHVNLNTTVNIIKNMNNGTAFGHDCINPMAIKLACTSLYKPINFITNLSISSGKFANRWKLAKVLPLYKGENKDKTDPDSYRLISLLPVLSKIVGKSVQLQTMDYMERTKQWNGVNHAYKKSYSTTTTLLQISDKITEACDKNEIAIAMGIDQSCAFDCVDHTSLCDKMRLYNYDKDTIKWMMSYLEARTQYVAIGAHISIMKPVAIGVPQGSVLGPLMFTLYINELSDIVNNYGTCEDDSHAENEKLFNRNCNKCGSVPGYADDTTFITSSGSRQTNQLDIIEKFNRIKKFLNVNKLTVNSTKTTLIEVMTRQKRARLEGNPPQIQVLNKSAYTAQDPWSTVQLPLLSRLY